MNLEIRIQNLENWMNSFCIFVKKNFMGIPELKEMIKLKLENADGLSSFDCVPDDTLDVRVLNSSKTLVTLADNLLLILFL